MVVKSIAGNWPGGCLGGPLSVTHGVSFSRFGPELWGISTIQAQNGAPTDEVWSGTRHDQGADARTTRAALHTLDAASGSVQASEEALVMHALILKDGLSQRLRNAAARQLLRSGHTIDDKAALAGHPGHWTNKDLQRTRNIRSRFGRSRGYRGPTPKGAWRLSHVIAAHRRQLQATVNRYQTRGANQTRNLGRGPREQRRSGLARPCCHQPSVAATRLPSYHEEARYSTSETRRRGMNSWQATPRGVRMSSGTWVADADRSFAPKPRLYPATPTFPTIPSQSRSHPGTTASRRTIGSCP